MWIMVAGPYSAPTPEERAANLRALNRVAAAVHGLGHLPVIGCNVALPVVAEASPDDENAMIMELSLAAAERCDGVLVVGESPGVEREVEVFRRAGKPVWSRIEDLPPAV